MGCSHPISVKASEAGRQTAASSQARQETAPQPMGMLTDWLCIVPAWEPARVQPAPWPSSCSHAHCCCKGCMVKELRSRLIRHTGFSFNTHWKQTIFVLFPVGIRGLVLIHKLCLWQTKEKSIYSIAGVSPVEYENTVNPSRGCFCRSG